MSLLKRRRRHRLAIAIKVLLALALTWLYLHQHNFRISSAAEKKATTPGAAQQVDIPSAKE